MRLIGWIGLAAVCFILLYISYVCLIAPEYVKLQDGTFIILTFGLVASPQIMKEDEMLSEKMEA